MAKQRHWQRVSGIQTNKTSLISPWGGVVGWFIGFTLPTITHGMIKPGKVTPAASARVFIDPQHLVVGAGLAVGWHRDHCLNRM
jgi:hypothetical protein